MYLHTIHDLIWPKKPTNITNMCVPGKHYVCKLQTIPRSMLKKPITTSPIIYKYHKCNCYPSKCIQRIEPKFFRSFWWRRSNRLNVSNTISLFGVIVSVPITPSLYCACFSFRAILLKYNYFYNWDSSEQRFNIIKTRSYVLLLSLNFKLITSSGYRVLVM